MIEQLIMLRLAERISGNDLSDLILDDDWFFPENLSTKMKIGFATCRLDMRIDKDSISIDTVLMKPGSTLTKTTEFMIDISDAAKRCDRAASEIIAGLYEELDQYEFLLKSVGQAP